VQAGALKIKSIINRNSLSQNIEQIRKYVLQNSGVGFRCEGKINNELKLELIRKSVQLIV
jgi:hypothetical protein